MLNATGILLNQLNYSLHLPISNATSKFVLILPVFQYLQLNSWHHNQGCRESEGV